MLFRSEIGAQRPEQLTPADVTTPPHWAYTLEASEIVTPAHISMEISEDIPGEEIRSRDVRLFPSHDMRHRWRQVTLDGSL